MWAFFTWRIYPGFWGRHPVLRMAGVVLLSIAVLAVVFHLGPNGSTNSDGVSNVMDNVPASQPGLPKACYRTSIPYGGPVYVQFREFCPQSQQFRQTAYDSDVLSLRSGYQYGWDWGEDVFNGPFNAFPWCTTGTTCAVPSGVVTIPGFETLPRLSPYSTPAGQTGP